MTKRAAKKLMMVGRAMVFTVGLAVTLALMAGVATAALAAVPGDPFKLGSLNTVNALTRLVGNRAGGMLLVDNTSTAANARALDLRVEPGRAPLVVNAEAGKAANLNSDKLDGRDSTSFANGFNGKANDADRLDGKDSSEFMPMKTYFKGEQRSGPGGGAIVFVTASCDSGDLMLGGGGGGLFGDDLLFSKAVNTSDGVGWQVQVADNGSASSLILSEVRCVDLPPLR